MKKLNVTGDGKRGACRYVCPLKIFCLDSRNLPFNCPERLMDKNQLAIGDSFEIELLVSKVF